MAVRTIRGARTKVNRKLRDLEELGIDPPPLPESQTVHSLMLWVSQATELIIARHRAERNAWETLTSDINAIANSEPSAAHKRFREAATRHHPDHGGDARRFRLLRSVYETTKD